MENPPLAQFKPLSEYKPRYGDYFIWSRWFSTWHGIVSNYDDKTNKVSVIFAGVPYLLFTMDESDQERETRTLKLSDIVNAPNGKYAIQTVEGSISIWYI